VDGKGGIKYTPVFEVGLGYVLQFNDERITLLIFTVEVKHRFPVRFRFAQVLSVEVRQVMDLLPVAHHLVQKVDQ
jgi:hypothetical protein